MISLLNAKACFMKCKWSWIHYLWPPFATITLKRGTLLYAALLCQTVLQPKKKALAPSHIISTLINVRLCQDVQRFTGAAVLRETWVDAEQHDEAICVAEQAMAWWQEDPGVYGWHINIWQYQYTSIDGLQCPVTYPLSEVFENEMLHLINWAGLRDVIIRGGTGQQPEENVNFYLLTRAAGGMNFQTYWPKIS